VSRVSAWWRLIGKGQLLSRGQYFQECTFMTSSQTTKALLLVMVICLCAMAFQVQSASAQQKGAAAAAPPPQKEVIPPDSDYMFRKFSAQIDEIKGKPDALLAWVKANPLATRSIAYAAAYYGQAVSEAMKSDPQKAIAMLQTFQAAAPADRTLIQMELAAYFQAKNFAKAAEIAEKLYAEKPTFDGANTLYLIYSQPPPNLDKLLVYGEKLLAEVPIGDKSFGVALQMAKIYGQKNNAEKVLSYYSKLMEIYGEKVPPNVKEADWNAERAIGYTLMARDSYSKKDYPRAIELYEKVTRFAPHGDEACQAYLQIGMAKWQGKDQKGAIEPFAKATVLNKACSAKAREYLEQLYKNENGGKLDGLDAVLAKAKSDLGVR
jgi:tetratricopeptide (TPR) repeat protein